MSKNLANSIDSMKKEFVDLVALEKLDAEFQVWSLC